MARGYHSYRGRRSKGQVALAVLLAVMILLSLAVMLLSRHIVYDETGTPRLELPWGQDAPEETQPPQTPELTIQDEVPEQPPEEDKPPLLALSLAAPEDWQQALSGGYNAAAVTVKDNRGLVYFDSAAAVPGAVKVSESLAALNESELHTIARMSCFHDPKAANSDVEGMGLKNTGGYIFYDGNNSQWLDPAKPAARAYLCALAAEAAELGFDELLLTDVGYPTVGKLDKIAYGEGDRSAHLTAFLQELRTALEPYPVTLSIELSPEGGLTAEQCAPLVDRVYASGTAEELSALRATMETAAPAAELVAETDAAMDGESCLVLP